MRPIIVFYDPTANEYHGGMERAIGMLEIARIPYYYISQDGMLTNGYTHQPLENAQTFLNHKDRPALTLLMPTSYDLDKSVWNIRDDDQIFYDDLEVFGWLWYEVKRS